MCGEPSQKGTKMGKSNRKLEGTGQINRDNKNFKSNNKPRWGKKGYGSAIQGKGTTQATGESSSSSVATVMTRTNTKEKKR